MQPPVADESLRNDLNDMGCTYGVMDVTPDVRQQVSNDPDASDDDEVIPALAEDSSDDELGMDIEEDTTHAA